MEVHIVKRLCVDIKEKQNKVINEKILSKDKIKSKKSVSVQNLTFHN
jgi:hypothetical protein